MSVNFLDFAEIIIRRYALDLAAGAADPGFSWDDFPQMAMSYVRMQWVEGYGRSARTLSRYSVELTVRAEAVARDHFKAHVAQPGIFVYESADLPGQWVAHDLLTDTVTQGNSRHHAISMLGEALALRACGAGADNTNTRTE